MLYIDNPVGTGFSFSEHKGFCKNMTCVGKHMYLGLAQFLMIFPWLQKNDLYLTGESFAGKYIPAIGNEIMERNKNSNFKLNLKVNLNRFVLVFKYFKIIHSQFP